MVLPHTKPNGVKGCRGKRIEEKNTMDMIKKFKFLCYPEVVYGENAVSQLPDIVKTLHGNRLLVVVDAHFAETVVFKDIITLLECQKIDFRIFDKLAGEPTTDIGDECAAFGRSEDCDIVCGIGGGSSLDTAKAASVLITNGGSVRDYQGLNKVPRAGLPKIMVPTTAGSGSEVTFTAVFIRKDEKKKGGINSPFLYPESAILDPVLTISLPPSVTASTGLDALCHAVESFLSKQATFISKAISLYATKLIWDSLPKAYENGKSLKARASMLYGSFLAGTGLANAGVTAVHSISYPLGGVFNVPHGVANGLLLPYVLEFEKDDIAEEVSLIYDYINKDVSSFSCVYKTERFIEEIKRFIQTFSIPGLKDLNIPPEDFPQLAKDALEVAVPIGNNPKPIAQEDIVEIYRKAYDIC